MRWAWRAGPSSEGLRSGREGVAEKFSEEGVGLSSTLFAVGRKGVAEQFDLRRAVQPPWWGARCRELWKF